MNVHWEPAPPEAFPIVAYRVYTSKLQVQASKARSRTISTVWNTFVEYPIHLPYTRDMLLRRAEAGQDVPEFFNHKE
jgi:hypothetical protein